MMATPEDSAPAVGEAPRAPAQPRPRQQPGRARTWLKRIAAVLALLGLAVLVAAFLVVRHYEADLPSTAELKSYHPPQVTRILARDGTVLGELFVERRTLVPIADIPVR